MNKAFDVLDPSQLLLILKHLKLGNVHLKKILTEKEFQELIKLAPVDKTEFSNSVKSTEFLLPFNGAITGVLGGWLGLSSYLEVNSNSYLVLGGILAVALSIGLFLGRTNVKLVRSSIQNGYENRKLEELQRIVIEKLQVLRKIEIDEKLKEIEANSGHPTSLDSILKKGIEKDTIPSFHKLIHSRHFTIPKPSWIRANLGTLIISFVPTVLGAFGSVFFYLPTVPNIAKKFGHNHVFETLTTHEAKAIQLFAVLCVTVYLCIHAVVLNRRAFKRDKELQMISQQIAQKENNLSLLDDQLLKVKEVMKEELVKA